jgi:hypothetical protein
MQTNVYYQPDGEVVRKTAFVITIDHLCRGSFWRRPSHLRFSREPYAQGDFMVALVREDRGKWRRVADNTARYLPGRMEWQISDPNCPALKSRWRSCLAATFGFTVRLRAKGTRPGDCLVWALAVGVGRARRLW